MKKIKDLPPLVRLATACGLFLLVLAVVLTVVIQPQERSELRAVATTANDPAGEVIFYKNIGVSPRNLSRGQEEGKKGPTQFTVEISKVRSKNEAEKIIHDLSALGVDAFFTPLHKEGRVFFRVRSGVYPSEDVAAAEAKKLQKNHSLNTKVTRL